MSPRLASAALLAASWVGAPTGAVAQTVLKEEPPMGRLRPGQRVLVDDGSCGPGRILEVTGGDHIKAGGGGQIVRQRRCVPRR